MLKVLLRVLAVVVLAGAIAGGQAPVRPGAIAGTVVDAKSGKAIGAVLVSIAEGPNTPPLEPSPGLHGRAQILTGADGRFVFRDLPAGSYTITAAKNGYGDRRVAGRTMSVPDAGSSRDVTVRMWKFGVITGTVIDESGEPVVGVQLRALVRSTSSGQPRFMAAGRPASTDDRGIYRFGNLPPGDYLVVASAPNVAGSVSLFEDVARTGTTTGPIALPPGRPTAIQVGDAFVEIGRGGAIPPPPIASHLFIYPPTFHPAALDPRQAAVVTLGSGEERAGVDLQIQPVPTARVTGRLEGPGLHGGEYVRLTRMAWRELTPDLDQDGPSVMADRSDRFVLPAVPAGDYVVRAIATDGASSYFVATPITVAGPEVDVTAVTRPVLRVSFHYDFEGDTEKPGTPAGFVSPMMLERVDGGTGPTAISGSMSMEGRLEKGGGRFQLRGFEPGRYRVVVRSSPAGWMFKSAMLDGVDVSETPFDMTRDVDEIVLTFTDRWSGIGGAIQGGEADGAIVLVFPTNTNEWGTCPRRCRTASVDSQGKFGVSSLPAGDYYVVAIPEEQADLRTDPRIFEALTRIATRVTILEGEHKTIDLEVRRVPQ